jgi:aspartyl protease family protein
MRLLLLASVLIMLVAVAAPGLLTRAVALRGAASDASEHGGQPVRAAAARTGEQDRVEIKAGQDGHFYVEAEINSRPVRLMVDTGATVIALRRSDAEAAGIRVRPGDFATPVATANGTINAAHAELDSISVRDIELNGVPALVLPDEQLGISLLGASFLNRLERFQVSDGTLVLEN